VIALYAKLPAIAAVVILLMAALYFVGSEDDDDRSSVGSGSADVTEYPFGDIRNFTLMDPTGNVTLGELPWAVFNRSHGGNCCEHYLATTQYGWITNLGGEYPTWSEDGGITWQDYRPITEPFDGLGEGAIIQAPNGDILSMSWFPYSGDRFISFFYDYAAEEWSYLENHWGYAPFYDRPWIVAVQGPIDFLGGTYPWASIVVSNFWQDAVVSLDGLTYVQLAEPDSAVGSVEFDLDYEPGPEYDYQAPHREIRGHPLPDGGLLLPRYFGDDNALLQTDLTWTRHRPVEGDPIPAEHLVIDSTGALHSCEVSGTTLTYHLSMDGGRTWNPQEISLPEGGTVEEWEFQADGVNDVAYVYMRAQVDTTDVDYLWHIWDYSESQEPDWMTLIGQGDLDATSGAGNDVRFDFASLAITPEGSAVVSYMDTTDVNPLFGLEIERPEIA